MSNIHILTEIICQSDFKSYRTKVALHNSARLEQLLMCAIDFPAYWLIPLIEDINIAFK